jgi:hypothetical protein
MDRFGELGGAELGLPPRDRLGYTAMASISR